MPQRFRSRLRASSQLARVSGARVVAVQFADRPGTFPDTRTDEVSPILLMRVIFSIHIITLPRPIP